MPSTPLSYPMYVCDECVHQDGTVLRPVQLLKVSAVLKHGASGASDPHHRRTDCAYLHCQLPEQGHCNGHEVLVAVCTLIICSCSLGTQQQLLGAVFFSTCLTSSLAAFGKNSSSEYSSVRVFIDDEPITDSIVYSADISLSAAWD